MSGSYETESAIVNEIGTVLATGQAEGAITASRLDQLELDIAATEAPAETALTYSSTLAWALDTNPVAYVTLTGNTTITLSAGQNGHSYRLAVLQGTGSHTVALAGCTVLGTPTWATAASGINLVTVEVVNGTRYVAVA